MADVFIRKPDSDLDGAQIQGAASEATLESLRKIAETVVGKNHQDLKQGLKNLEKAIKSIAQTQSEKTSKKTRDRSAEQIAQAAENIEQMSRKFTGLQDQAVKSAFSLSKKRSTFSLADKKTDKKPQGTDQLQQLGLNNVTALMSQVGLLKNITKLNPWVLAAATAFEALGAVVGSVIRMMGGFVASGIKMITLFVDGENRLSSFVKVLAEAVSSIPIVGGILGSLVGIVSEVIRSMESWRDTQTQLAVNGAAFGQNLILMRKTAEDTGLGLEKFASVVSSNTENFAKFGTVTTGALRFSKVVSALRENLRNMGYSLEDVSEGVAQAMGLLGTGAAARMIGDSELNKAASNLMMEFDALAKLTGQSRKSQADALKKQSMTAAFQMALSRMGTTQQQQVNAEMARMQSMFGDVGAEMVKLRILGMVPFTKEQQMMTVTMSDSVNEIYALTDQIKAGAIKQEEFDQQLDSMSARALKAAGRDAAKFEPILRAAASGIGGSAADVSKNFDELYSRMGQFLTDGQFNEEAFKKSMAKIREEQKARSEMANSLNKFEDTMIRLRTMLIDKVYTPLYNKFGPVFESFVNNFEVKWLPYFEKNISSLGNFLSNLATDIKQLFTNESLQSSVIESFELLIDRVSIEMQKLIGKSTLARALGFGYNDEDYQAEIETWRKKVAARKELIRGEFQQARANEIQENISSYESTLKKLQADKVSIQAEIDKLGAEQTAERQELTAKLAKTDANINILTNSIAKDRIELDTVKKDQEKQSAITAQKMKDFREAAEVTDKNKKWQGAHQVGAGGAALGASIGAFGGPVGALAGGALGYLIGAPIGYFNATQQAPESDTKMKDYLTNQINSKKQEAEEVKKQLETSNNKLSELKSQTVLIDEKDKQRHEEEIKVEIENNKKLKKALEDIDNSVKSLKDVIAMPPAAPLLPAEKSGLKQATGMATGTTTGEVNQRFGEVERRLLGGNIRLKSGALVGNNYVSKEAVAGGEIMENTMRVIESLKNQLPGEITGINDLWHQQNAKGSKHALGEAFDMSLTQQPNLPEFTTWLSKEENKNKKWSDFLKTQEATAWMTKKVEAAAGDIPVKVINEYENPTEKSTGGHLHVELRKYGSIGATGRAFENFGTQTPAVLHGVEGVFTPSQLKMIVTDSQSKLTKIFNDSVKTLIDTNTRNQFEPLIRSVNNNLTTSADHSKQLMQAVNNQLESTKQMKEILTEVVSAINRSNSHLNAISRTV